jgi:hypothetical protein
VPAPRRAPSAPHVVCHIIPYISTSPRAPYHFLLWILGYSAYIARPLALRPAQCWQVVLQLHSPNVATRGSLRSYALVATRLIAVETVAHPAPQRSLLVLP